MVNPRQRRKLKSKSYKPVRTTSRNRAMKKQPPIRGPKAIREAWDAKKTVKQNYVALGLVASLAPNISGGVELVAAPQQALAPLDNSRERNPAQAGSSAVLASKSVRKGHGRIVRDATGKVVRVELADEDIEAEAATKGDARGEMKSLDVTLNASAFPVATMGIERGQGSHGLGGKQVVHELEELSKTSQRLPRRASDHEVIWLRDLVKVHGQDIDAMSKDRRLNVWQRTPGELKRAIAKAGGFSRLTG